MEKRLQAMMARFPLFIAMGFMIVVIALIIGAWNAGNASTYFAVDKLTRETSPQLAQLRAIVESTTVWLPYFKFLGLAMIMAGIIMALGVINLRLRDLGIQVMAAVPESARLPIPDRPASIMLMRLFMMIGMLIIIIGLVVSISIAIQAFNLFSNPITVIDSAQTGSSILASLASVHSTEAWLEAFKFVGVAFFFLSIINGLHAVVFALRYQWDTIPKVARNLPTTTETTVPAPAD